MERQGGRERGLRPPLRRLLAAGAAVGVLLAPGLLPPSGASFSATTSDTGNEVTTAEVAAPSALAAAQTCAPGPGIAYRGHTSASVSNSTLVLTAPSSTAVGDVLVAQVSNRYDDANAISAPSDWAQIRRTTSGSAGNAVTSAVYWHVATAAGATAHTFGLQNTTNIDMAGGIVGFSGVRTNSPVDVHDALTGTGVSATLPSIETTVAGTMLVHLTTKRQEALQQPTSTSPLWRLKSSTTGTDNQGVSAGYETFAGPGWTPTRTASSGGTASLEWIGQTVALRPASGPPSASLTWTATPSSWATDYELERVVSGSIESSTTVTPITATSATDGLLLNGTAYTYRLRARHGSWVSPDATTTFTPSC